jgi:phosphoglycolate phosphatase
MAENGVILFDIDGTLITSGGAGRGALERAVAEFLGRPMEKVPFPFAGMTDRAIMRGALRAFGQPVTEAIIDDLLAQYLTVLSDEVARAVTYAVHPGMIGALEWLATRQDVAVGLGTGNIEAGARIKLERVGLNRFFDFGGFGCDAEPREGLIAKGFERGAQRLSRTIETCRLLVIGDTPSDVRASRLNGGETLAVCTGGATRAALEATDAEWVFDSLASPGAMDVLKSFVSQG